MIRLLRIGKGQLLAMNPMGCSYIIPLRIAKGVATTWSNLAAMKAIHITEEVVLDLEGHFLHAVCRQDR